MGFIDDGDKVQHWKYNVSEFTLIFPDSTTDIPTERIISMMISNDYENALFPVMNINVVLEPSVYNQIIQNKNDVKIKIRVQKYYTLTGSDEKSLLRDYFNTTFSLILDDDYLYPDTYIDIETDANTDVGKSDLNRLDEMDNKIELPLYKYEVINGMRTMVNTVLQNVTMIGAIAYIGATTGIDNILVSPLENNTQYSELIIPPQTALSAIQYLDSEYGFYRYGSIIFFGIDRSYILNYKGGCTAYERDEIQETCIIIPERGGTYGSMEGGLEKANETDVKKYVMVRMEHVDVKNVSISSDILDGNKATIVNTNTNTIISASSGTTQIGSGNSSVINTNTSNQWVGETYAAQKAANSAVITISCGDFDADAITPNKKFTFLFEDTKSSEKYKGTYILTNSFLRFTKNGSDFTLDASMTFKRPSTDVTVTSESL